MPMPVSGGNAEWFLHGLEHDRAASIRRREIAVTVAALGSLGFNPVMSIFCNGIRQFITLPFKLDTLFFYAVFFGIVIYAMSTILARSTLLLYGIILFPTVGLLVSMLRDSANFGLYSSILSRFFQTVPWMFATYAVRDFKLFKKFLPVIEILVLLFVLLNYFVYSSELFGGNAYDQTVTYALLPAAVIACGSLFEKIRIYQILILIVSVTFLFLLGTRGPIVCLILFLLMKILLTYKNEMRVKIALVSFFFAVGIPLYLFYYDILNMLIDLAKKTDLSARPALKILAGTFLEDKSRNKMSEYTTTLIRQNLLKGVGVGRDRVLLASLTNSNVEDNVFGMYPHNIFLELLLQFGVFIGGAILLYLVVILFMTTFRNPDRDSMNVICIFIAVGFFPLLFSESYLSSHNFFAMLGFCLSQYRKYNQNHLLKEIGILR